MKQKAVPVDLHQHLQTHPDISKVSFNQVIDLIRSTYGDECIVGLTNFRDYDSKGLRDDHRYEDFTSLKGYARKSYGNHIRVGNVRVIKVQEVPVLYEGKEVHLLCIGLKEGEHIEPRKDLLKTLHEMGERELITILDHPFARSGIGELLVNDKTLEKKVLPLVTSLEVFNGITAKSFPLVSDGKANERAQHYFDAVKEAYPELGAIVGTDGQSLNAVRNGSYSLINVQLSEEGTDSQLIKRLGAAMRSHRSTENDRKVPQSRFEIFGHVVGIVKEGGIKHTLSRL